MFECLVFVMHAQSMGVFATVTQRERERERGVRLQLKRQITHTIHRSHTSRNVGFLIGLFKQELNQKWRSKSTPNSKKVKKYMVCEYINIRHTA